MAGKNLLGLCDTKCQNKAIAELRLHPLGAIMLFSFVHHLKKSDRANQGEQAWMGLMAASYFSHRQVGGWIELRRISVQHGLRLISLSNYVFVLEISQISGIVQNVSMLIMVVMRIVVVVREEKVEKECYWNRKLPVIQVLSICCLWFTWKMLLLSMKYSVSPPFAGAHLFVADHKKVPFHFPPCASAASVSQHQGCNWLTWRHLLIFPSLVDATTSVRTPHCPLHYLC